MSMYCILVTGIPASGKTTLADRLSGELSIPVFSKDRMKERLYDDVGFRCREEKVRLGTASMNLLYYVAEELMKRELPFILENNFEHVSKAGLEFLLEKYAYTAITIRLTGDYPTIYQRFVQRNASPERHRGHVVNDCYPEREGRKTVPAPLSYEDYVAGIRSRGMDTFAANGPCLDVDVTDLEKVDWEGLRKTIQNWIQKAPE